MRHEIQFPRRGEQPRLVAKEGRSFRAHRIWYLMLALVAALCCAAVWRVATTHAPGAYSDCLAELADLGIEANTTVGIVLVAAGSCCIVTTRERACISGAVP